MTWSVCVSSMTSTFVHAGLLKSGHRERIHLFPQAYFAAPPRLQRRQALTVGTFAAPAQKMHNISLAPTSTGGPGGMETGHKVTHVIVDGGPFARSCDR